MTLFQMRNRERANPGVLAVQKLEMSLTDMVKHLGISVSGVEYAVERGEAIARDKNYHLINLFSFLRGFRFLRSSLTAY